MIENNRYFLPSFLTLVVVTALHWVASELDYYWTVAWYDVMMHFLGGAWVVLFALWVCRMPFARKLPGLVTFQNLLLFALLVGVAWEIHELVLRFADPSRPEYLSDTILDLVMDMLGAAAVCLIYRKRIASRRHEA